jgi:2-aminoethylphosphonate-pyruvate transaminase
MISSCVPDGGKLLIVDNGTYGARFAKIASVYGLNHEVFKSSGFLPPDKEAVKAKLAEGGFSHFALVYHETTTGLLNPVPELCRFCRDRGIVTIVDAVSAFAAIPIDMDRDAIDFMASTSNKNIQAMAGVALVFCRKESLEAIKKLNLSMLVPRRGPVKADNRHNRSPLPGLQFRRPPRSCPPPGLYDISGETLGGEHL